MTEEIEVPVIEDVKPVELPQEVEKVAAEEVKPVEKKKHVIQPMREGQPVGQPHVYNYTDDADLQKQLSDAVANGTAKIAELTRERKLKPQEFKAPEGAELARELPAHNPKILTAEERLQLASDLKDPEKIDSAFDRLYEARFGRKPEDSAKMETENYNNGQIVRMKAETDMFVSAHPDFYPCAENQQAFVDYFSSRKMAWNKKNLELAYGELSTDGLLVAEPVSAPEERREVQTRTEPAPKPAKTVFPAQVRRGTASAAGPVLAKKPSTEEEAMLSAEEYKRRYPELANAR